MPLRLGLIVNPVAGIGGPAGLKGSDDRVLEAVDRGYGPTAQAKAERFLARIQGRADLGRLRLLVAPGAMGGDVADALGLRYAVLGPSTAIHDPFATEATDTQEAAAAARSAQIHLLAFVGGDGTANDIMQVVGTDIPILGVPAGVKMFSECFAETPEVAADLVAELVRDLGDDPAALPTAPAEVLDLDEDAYRAGRMRVDHRGSVLIPRSPRIQSAKCPACPQDGLDEIVAEVLLRMREDPDALYVIASGSTTGALKQRLGIGTQPIGIDAVRIDPDSLDLEDADGTPRLRGLILGQDLDARGLEKLAADALRVTVIVSPIGGQGFILGRGTGPLTPPVIEAALPDRLWVLATTGKMASIEDGMLHADTGSPALDDTFPGHLRVILGLGRERVVKVHAGSAPIT